MTGSAARQDVTQSEVTPWCGRTCHGIRRVMGRIGSSYADALAECFWQGRKRETMHQRVFVTMSQARRRIFRWLTYYNARREGHFGVN
ncbi:integrase core domain-containing protein [Streptomyces hokutonensis]|uniref:integrase core domain-containing protein n=1 Tax=Streptomyces hokutonensis TaxID=1306990 RepID=UPI0038260BBF